MPPVSETPTGFFFPIETPISSSIFLGAQGGYFGYCQGGPSAGLNCADDSGCPGGTCTLTLDNTFCLSYNMSCSGLRVNRSEYGMNDVFETTYDSSPASGRQTFIERNWNYISADGTFWRPFHFALEVDANSTCVGGTNEGAACTLRDAAGTCAGGGTCTGQLPTGGARWSFIPNNRNGNSSLLLTWPFAAINARLGTDDYWTNGFSSWMRSSDFDSGSMTSGAQFTTYLDHANDRSGLVFNGLHATIDFNATSPDSGVGYATAGYFNARISGPTPWRQISALTGVRAEVNLASTGGPQLVGPAYGVFVQFNPTGSGITASSYTGILVNTPAPSGGGTTVRTQDGIVVADQQLSRSTGDGSAIRVSSQTTRNGLQGNLRFDGGDWNTGHVQLLQGHVWRDAAAGGLRYKDTAAPSSHSDGNAIVMGTASASHGVVLWGVSTAIDPNFDTGREVCAASGLTCVSTSEFDRTNAIACNQTHATAPKWLAFCK